MSVPCFKAEIADRDFIAVTMLPEQQSGRHAGGRAILTPEQARMLRDALSEALTIDDLRQTIALAEAELARRLA